jgi:O-antigen/teichoic acid export membrane protein
LLLVTVYKKNIAANFAGNLWTALMSLVFVPLYIRFMGIEAYGLMGIFAVLLGLFALLDMGLSGTLNREMARLSVQKDKAQEMRDLVRTLEIPYWLVGLVIAGIVFLASPLIAYHWVKVKDLPHSSVRTAVVLMGLCVAFQWPMSFYSGGLIGLQRQVLLNGVNAVMATFRGLGAVLILWLVSPTVEAFFFWQIAVSIAHIGLIVFFLWRSLPPAAHAPRFRFGTSGVLPPA